MPGNERKSRKVLLITNTYFQLIVSIQLRRTILKKTDADIIITNHSRGCEDVCERVKKTGLFRQVFFLQQESRNFPNDIRHRLFYFAGLMLKWKKNELSAISDLPSDYDEIWFNNAITLTHLIWKHSPNAVLYRFEEGFSTYTKPIIEKKFVKFSFRIVFGNIEKSIKKLYLFHPELFFQSSDIPLAQIPMMKIADVDFRDILNRIFDYSPDEEYKNKSYIFFEESFRADGEQIPDLALIEKVSNFVGKDQLLVKRHPRNRDNPFPAMGIKTDNNTKAVPWEIILINETIKGKTLMSISSGCILSPVLYFPIPVKSYLLFKCLPEKPKIADRNYEKFLSQIQKIYTNLLIPENFQQLEQEIADKS